SSSVKNVFQTRFFPSLPTAPHLARNFELSPATRIVHLSNFIVGDGAHRRTLLLTQLLLLHGCFVALITCATTVVFT
ncbi:hypothetical protein V5799_021831, partial [Amblyomma americanum]